jgi:hypothetical protein
MRFVAGTPGANALIWNYHPRVRRSFMGSANVDIDRGREIMGQYYSAMLEKYGMEDSFEDFLVKYKYNEGFLEGLGLGANQAGLSYSDVNDAMIRLATMGNGKIPANKSAFSTALINKSAPITLWQPLQKTVDVVTTTVDRAEDLADQAIDKAVEYGEKAESAVQSYNSTVRLVTVAAILGLSIFAIQVYVRPLIRIK